MTTRINRAKNAAANASVPIKLIVGHGGLVWGPKIRVPDRTYIIFLAKPGHLLPQSAVLDNPQMFNQQFVRDVITRRIRPSIVQPIQFSKWTKHFYGPQDVYPNLMLELYDADLQGRPLVGTPYDLKCGVTNLNTGRRLLHGQLLPLSSILRVQGPGIYIVSACRASDRRVQTSPGGRQGVAFREFYAGITPRMTPRDPTLNRFIEKLENEQARYAKYKRAFLPKPTVRRNITKRRKPNPPFAPNRVFSFHPGKSPSRPRTGTRARTGTRPRTGTRAT